MGVMRVGLLLGVAIGVATLAWSSARGRDARRREREIAHDRWEDEGGSVPATQVGSGLQGRPAALDEATEAAVLGGAPQTASQRVPFPGGSA